MNANIFLNHFEQIGVGLALIIFPILFIFAFAVHPGLLRPRLLGPKELILRAHGNKILQFGHVLVTLNTGLLIVVALHFMKLLDSSSLSWAGFVGAAIAILGAIFLAAVKGALCLTMSAFDTLPEKVFAQIMPGVMAMFTKQGWLVLLWGVVCLPIGFGIQSISLFAAHTIPVWQSLLFLIGVLLVSVPDGLITLGYALSFSIGATRLGRIYYWNTFFAIGMALFVIGFIIRIHSLLTLKQYFTYFLAKVENHKIIETGLYKFIRHPGYLGQLIIFIGISTAISNWISILVMMIPITLGYIYRIKVEERFMLEQLGGDYLDYQERTKRLIPMIY